MKVKISRFEINIFKLKPFWVLSEKYRSQTYRLILFVSFIYRNKIGKVVLNKQVKISVPLWWKKSFLDIASREKLDEVCKYFDNYRKRR